MKRIVMYLLVASVLGAGGGLWLYRNQSAESVLPPLAEIDAIGAADLAKGRFEGEMGDFLVLNSIGDRAKEAFVFGCGDEAYTFERNMDILRRHELWAAGFGADGNGVGCEGSGIHIVNNDGDDGRRGATGLARFYLDGLPMPVLAEAPSDRLELIEVEGHPAVIEHPVEGFPFAYANLTVIERYPVGDVPGIVVRVTLAPSSEKAIALAEELMP